MTPVPVHTVPGRVGGVEGRGKLEQGLRRESLLNQQQAWKGKLSSQLMSRTVPSLQNSHCPSDPTLPCPCKHDPPSPCKVSLSSVSGGTRCVCTGLQTEGLEHPWGAPGGAASTLPPGVSSLLTLSPERRLASGGGGSRAPVWGMPQLCGPQGAT